MLAAAVATAIRALALVRRDSAAVLVLVGDGPERAALETLAADLNVAKHVRFVGYRDAGVTRISLGVQSFDDAALARLGRIHGGDEARRAADEVQRAGFATFNLDLMVALPEQTAAQAVADARTALALGAPHISHYELTMEPNTLFFAHPPAGLPDTDLAAEIQDAARTPLAVAGMQRYEVSAWARPEHRCRHNLNYWNFGDYLGIGAGAHGKLTDAQGVIIRTTKHKHPTRYLAAASGAERMAGRAAVSAADLPFEFMLNALRLADGFTESGFESSTGLSFASIAPICVKLEKRGLMVQCDSCWQASAFGFERVNDLLLEFMAD